MSAKLSRNSNGESSTTPFSPGRVVPIQSIQIIGTPAIACLSRAVIGGHLHHHVQEQTTSVLHRKEGSHYLPFESRCPTVGLLQ